MQYEVDAVVEGTVVDVVKFGAFVKLIGGKTGLVHISQISDKYVQEITDHINVGSKVLVKIISIDEKKRIQLSIKAVTPEEEERHREEQTVTTARKTQKQERPQERPREERPREQHFQQHPPEEESFEKKMKMFLRQSEDRQVDIKRNIESKRGIKRKKSK